MVERVMQDPRVSSEEHGLPKENDGEASWGRVGGTAAPPERLTAMQMVATFSRAGPSVPPKTRDAPRPPLPRKPHQPSEAHPLEKPTPPAHFTQNSKHRHLC